MNCGRFPAIRAVNSGVWLALDRETRESFAGCAPSGGRKGDRANQHIERLNNTLRQRIARLVQNIVIF